MLGRSYDIQSGQLNNVEKVILKMLGQSVGQSTYMNDWNSLWLQGKSGVVRRTLTPSFQGSNPCSPARMRVFLEKGELFFCSKFFSLNKAAGSRGSIARQPPFQFLFLGATTNFCR